MAVPDSVQIALISGANTGIGKAVAEQLAKDHGYHVIIGSRYLPNGQAVADALVQAGHRASAVPLDVTSDASIAMALKLVERDFGRLDVLVNNAGILIDRPAAGGPPDELNPEYAPRELYQKTFEVNVFGAGCLTEAAIPLLRKTAALPDRQPPRVVFVSSRMGSLALSTDPTVGWYNIDYKVYDASKAALNIIAVNYSRLLSDIGARVNIVCPGLVNTYLTKWRLGGAPPEVGAQHVVKMAVLDKDGPTATFSALDGPMPW